MSDKNFLIKQITRADYKKELELIGFDKSYSHKAVNKFLYKNLKIYDLTVAQANIIKQLALSVGADCATHRDVITGRIEKSDAILSGSFSQLEKVSDKLRHQPFHLPLLADEIIAQISEHRSKTKIVGILNITPDSFSDGGKYNSVEAACKHFTELVSDGADVVDIGAESTKPMAEPVKPEIQLEKIIPVLEFIKKENYNIPISIDTRSSVVAEECLKYGASVINDVSGLKYDDAMAEVVAKNNATLILQHSLGNEKNMDIDFSYNNVVDDVYKDLYIQTQKAKNAGISSIIVDVGIGFDKDLEANFKLINRIDEFYSLGYPVMLGISRKSLLNLQNATNDEKDLYTVALNTLAIEHNVDYIRVHNVKFHKKLLDIYKKDYI